MNRRLESKKQMKVAIMKISKITAITMETESQTEQTVYNLENGVESKYHHDIQTGLEGQHNH